MQPIPKSNRLFEKSPAFIKVFNDLAKNAPQAEKVAKRIDNNKPTAKKLSELYVWISKKTLSPEEVATLTKMLEEFYAEVPSEIPPEDEVTLPVVPDVSVMRSTRSTKIIPLGAFIRSPDADAQLVVESLGNGKFSIRLGFLGKDYFSLSKGARWQFTGADVTFDDAKSELQQFSNSSGQLRKETFISFGRTKRFQRCRRFFRYCLRSFDQVSRRSSNHH